MVLAIALAWIACGVVTSGWMFADFQRDTAWGAEFNAKYRRRDAGFALFWGFAFGPIGLVVGFFLSGFAEHGWLNPFTRAKEA
jgi:hypothetical protein